MSDEDYESEEEEDEGESAYDSEYTQSEDYKSGSSLSNYEITEDMRGQQQHQAHPHENMYNLHEQQRNYHQDYNYGNNPAMYQSIPDSTQERNPKLMSSIGSDQINNAPQNVQNVQNPYGKYQPYR